MVDATTAPPAVAAAAPGFVAVASSYAARRPVRPLKRSRKDQAAEAAGLSVGAQAGGLFDNKHSTDVVDISSSSTSARLYERSP